MALARLISRGQSGLDAYEVSVEVDISGGLPTFTITGLPAPAVRESRERVRAALRNCGIEIPASRITAHLGPADIPKQGGRFDLPIALGIVAAHLHKSWRLDGIEFIGELSLGGALRPVTGVVSAALAARGAGRELVVPAANAAEAAIVPASQVLAANRLQKVIAALDGKTTLERVTRGPIAPGADTSPDLDEVRGHARAKRALTIAAAGGHNLLMIGPPGSGKSMLAARLPALLPPLTAGERLEVAAIASVAGRSIDQACSGSRPFRAPHHTTRGPALVGGGPQPKPGEISLAHHGVLFLDELPEFFRPALEALREPLETGRVRLSRLGHQVDFPAGFQLIAAMNPCPCGYYGDGTDRCRCGLPRVHQYLNRISGPLLDRFDLHIEVPQVPYAELATPEPGPCAALLATAVRKARQRQIARGSLNARLGERDTLALCAARTPAARLIASAQDRWQLSTRSVVRILRLAQTLADLAGRDRPGPDDVAEALQLRCLDRRPPIDTV